jgi:hypothetical protein
VKALACWWLSGCVLSFPRAPGGEEAMPPAVLYTDLESGPHTGGIEGLGAAVTIHGRRFGDLQRGSRVAIGGGEVARILSWADDEISVLLGPSVATGPVVVTTAAGASNDDVSFTVRPGNVYCVSIDGDDAASGAWGGCWATLEHAADNAAPGDVVYALDGVSQREGHRFVAALSIENAGEPGRPIAIAAFPGAGVVIDVRDLEEGDPPATLEGILVPRIGIDPAYWVFSGLTILADVHAIDSSATGWRIVDNDITCSEIGGVELGCIELTGIDAVFLGNDVHGIAEGLAEVPNAYSALRAIGDRTVVAFNRFHDLGTHASVRLGAGRTTVEGGRVFSNRFEDTVCGALDLGDLTGEVEVFNNVFARVGTGPDSTTRCGSAVAIDAGCSAASIRVFHNTIVDAGALLGENAGAIASCAGSALELENNLVLQPAAQRYLAGDGSPSGASNLWFGAGNGPSSTRGNIERDPMLDEGLRPGPASPARDAATGISPAIDFDGVARPQGIAADVGAFEAVD